MSASLAFVSTAAFFVSRVRAARRALSTAPVAKRLACDVLFGKRPDVVGLCTDELMDPVKKVEDPYYWMRDDDRKDPEVISYLEAENKYTEYSMQHTTGLQDELYKAMLSNLKEDDQRVPYRRGEFFYYTRNAVGQSYSIHCRKPVVSTSTATTQADDVNNMVGIGMEETPERVILDENKVADGLPYCVISEVEPSPSHSLLAYSLDSVGYETYDLRVVQLGSDEKRDNLVDVISETSGDIVWCLDDSTLFYLKMDAEHRPYQLWMHSVRSATDTDTGTSGDVKPFFNDDLLLLQENDGRMWMGIGKTNSNRFLTVTTNSPETTEIWMLDLEGLLGRENYRNNVGGMTATEVTTASDAVDRTSGGGSGSIQCYSNKLMCVKPRVTGVRYEIEHHDDKLYMVTNEDGAKNGKLVSSPLKPLLSRAPLAFTDVKPYDSSVQVEEFHPFSHYAVITGRSGGLQRVWRVSLTGPGADPSQWTPVRFGVNDDGSEDLTYSCWLSANYEYNANSVRLGFSSFTTPKQTLSVDLTSGVAVVLKEDEVPGFNADLYASRRISAKAKDGTEIPMSVVYRRDFSPWVDRGEGLVGVIPRPVILYGYGSYGACIDPTFDYKRLCLLDRGVTFVIAHIRGGGEMGRSWYEEGGKYLTKTNTFDDFRDCAAHLIESGVTSSEHMAGVGRSAGGLLIGAVANRSPHLFKALVADVPFVDVITTMADPSIPLTTTEWEEWGNPNMEKYFEYMKSYSPVDNIRGDISYPAMLVTGGLHDPRVAFWEPAKFVAKMRYETSRFQQDIDQSAGERNGDETGAGAGAGAKLMRNLPVYLKTDMESGHFSASDRYKNMREMAFEYSFILDQIIPSE